MAIDYGRKRIGVAVCDPLGVTVTGLETVHLTTFRETLDRLAAQARQLEAEMLLVGDPRNMDGSAGTASKEAREFGRKLARRSGLPVVYHDERLTSVEAAEMLRAEGRSGQERDGALDQAAAIILLRSYLSSRENQAED